MNTINSIYNIIQTEFLDKFDVYLSSQTRVIAYLILAFALCNCLFGYHLRKLWSALVGGLLGFVLATATAMYMGLQTTISYAVGLGGCLVLLLLSLLLYRIGVFLLCFGAVAITLYELPAQVSLAMLFVFLVIALIAALCTIPFEPYVLPAATALCGAVWSAKALSGILGYQEGGILFFLIALLLSAVGLLFQYRTTRNRRSSGPARKRQSSTSSSDRVRTKKKRKTVYVTKYKVKKLKDRRKRRDEDDDTADYDYDEDDVDDYDDMDITDMDDIDLDGMDDYGNGNDYGTGNAYGNGSDSITGNAYGGRNDYGAGNDYGSRSADAGIDADDDTADYDIDYDIDYDDDYEDTVRKRRTPRTSRKKKSKPAQGKAPVTPDHKSEHTYGTDSPTLDLSDVRIRLSKEIQDIYNEKNKDSED